ncbi:33 kDa inner dynein arm light chain, axonemal-like [Sipha flava]|nr:33 kDa inner dynein arm light chain, axonemal-like [Sipha flava]
MVMSPIKEQLYFQCFNEIIRQITIKNPEHGNVMIRIRDDLKMSIDGYRKLQESMIAKDIRKLLLKEKEKSNLEKMVQQLMSENERLEAEFAETTKMTQELELEIADKREEQALNRAKELDDIKKEMEIIKDRLRSEIARDRRERPK